TKGCLIANFATVPLAMALGYKATQAGIKTRFTTAFVETIGAAIYPQDISTPSYIEAESTRFFALRELHQVGDAVELFDQKLLDRRRGEFRLFHISLPPDERLLRHSPSAVPIGSAVQMRDFR
ncbi:hypothetical protein GNQ24_004980, partial [Escherichia coli]|nr:hypothetical protein [Escherichia coli]EEQ6008009.1 hypothetical protein [Escherichia coli]